MQHTSPTTLKPATTPFTYQVVLQRIWPDVVLDDLPKLIGSSVSMIGEPSEEAFWLFMLPLPPCFVLRLAGALGQVLRITIIIENAPMIHRAHKVNAKFDLKIKNAFIDAYIIDR